MPTLDFAFLADAAEAEPGRKFYVLGGGIDSIGAQSFPVVHPHMSLVMRLLVHPMEADHPHSLDIRLIDTDGRELTKLEGTFSADAGNRGGREAAINITLNFQNTRFERAGDYSLELLVNGQHLKSLPLRLQQTGA